MGNRAVITTKENYENDGVGIYLHWNGGRDSVRAFLAFCEARGYRAPSEDSYGWAYLATTIGNFFRDGLSLGVDRVSNLDCNNYDNGVYLIDGWEIVGREYAPSYEQDSHGLREMLEVINERQPEGMRLSDKQIDEIVKRDEAPDELGKFLDSIPVT